MAVQGRQGWPVQTGQIGRSASATCGLLLHGEEQPVQVGFTQASLDDFQEARLFQFLQVPPDTAFARSHIVGKFCLAGKAGVVAPCIFQQHCVGELRANGNVGFGEDEIRNLCKPVTRGEISADNFDVALFLFEDVADVPCRVEFHMLSLLYAVRDEGAVAYPPFLRCARVKMPSKFKFETEWR